MNDEFILKTKIKKTLNDEFILKTKIEKTLNDYLNIIYKVEFKENTSKENIIENNYKKLLFLTEKIRNIFKLLKKSFEVLKCKKINMPKTILGVSLFLSSLCLSKELEDSLYNIYKFKYFRIFRSISQIPKYYEYNFLGELDINEFEKNISEFDIYIKKYIGLVMKREYKTENET